MCLRSLGRNGAFDAAGKVSGLMTEPESIRQSSPPESSLPPRKVGRGVWLLLPVVVAGLAGLFLGPHRASRAARAEARLEMLPLAPSLAGPGDGPMPPLDISPEAQVGRLQSDDMARRTVDELRREAGRGSPLAVPLTETEVHDAVSAAHPPGTRLLVITAAAGTPAQASRLADAAARAFVRWQQENAQASAYYVVSQLRSDVGHARHRAQRLAAQASAASSGPGTEAAGTDLRQSAQQAAAEYQRLQATLDAARRRIDHVSSGVRIVSVSPGGVGVGGRKDEKISSASDAE